MMLASNFAYFPKYSIVGKLWKMSILLTSLSTKIKGKEGKYQLNLLLCLLVCEFVSMDLCLKHIKNKNM